jgi:hypothetical protein
MALANVNRRSSFVRRWPYTRLMGLTEIPLQCGQ